MASYGIDIDAFTELIAEICAEKEVQCCLKGSARGGLIAGVSAFAGGLFLGPIGLGVGGTVGGLVAAALAKKHFKSAASVIRNLTPQQKQQLFLKCKRIFNSFNIHSAVTLARILSSEVNLKEQLFTEVKKYLEGPMNLKVI